MKSFKQYLNEKDTVYGVFCKTNDPFFIKVLGSPDSISSSWTTSTAPTACGKRFLWS